MPTLDWLNRDAAFRAAENVPYRLLEFVSAHEPTVAPAREPAQKETAAQGDFFGRKGEKSAQIAPQVSTNIPPLPLGGGRGEGKPAATADRSADIKSTTPTRDNLLLQGDNLEALKALLPLYRGQVKCIFIDPPYNTKSAFEHYDDNLEHAQWLSMMLPRLQLLREFLREDGSIWVTIDDNEGHYLKVMMDEVFGRGNFVANVVWQKKYAVANDHKTIAPMHDHMLVFRKSTTWQRNLVERTDSKDTQYKHEDERGVFRVSDYTCNKTAEERPNLFYSVTNPNTKEVIWPKRTRVWGYSQEEFLRHLNEGFISWGKDGKGKIPGFKRYLHLLKHSGIVPQTLWEHTFAGHTDLARKEARMVLDTQDLADDFLTPKPELLISKVVEIATNPNDLILDSFLGSGTTAAVAQKMGRRWIGIEMGEHAQTHCLPRLQKVLDGEQGGISKAVNWHGGGSFQFVKLGAPIFNETGDIAPQVRFKDLAAFVWQQETRTAWQKHRKRGDSASSPLLGVHNGVAVFLLFNGILGDRRPQGGNVLTAPVLAWLKASAPQGFLPQDNGEPMRCVVYGEACRMGEVRLGAERITFRQIPYEIAQH